MQRESEANDTVRFLEAHLGRAGEPISDSLAEQSRKLTEQAMEWRNGDSVASPSEPVSLSRIAETLRKAIELDPRNALAMTLLADWAPARQVAGVVERIAKRATDFRPDGRGEATSNWSCGTWEERLYVSALVGCAITLDAAERYNAANRIRLAVMKIDQRDGSGLRRNIMAHALMIGDLRTAAKWLRWVKREQQSPEFWCWATVLFNRLSGNEGDTEDLGIALRHEPLVPHFLAAGTPGPETFTDEYIVAGSDREQEYHASLLYRSWLAHPDDYDWLCEVADFVSDNLAKP